MALGIIPARGPWTTREFTTTSTATFFKGCAVTIAKTGNTLSEYSGGGPGFLGASLISSINSLPATKVQVAIPNGPECTAMIDVPTGIVASKFSIGYAFGLYKQGNMMSFWTDAYTSDVSCPIQVVGPCDSTLSRIEVAFLTKDLLYGSSASQILL